MAKKIKPFSQIQFENFEQALGEHYGVDGKEFAPAFLGKISSLLRENYDIAGIKQATGRKAKIVILGVEDEEGGEE